MINRMIRFVGTNNVTLSRYFRRAALTLNPNVIMTTVEQHTLTKTTRPKALGVPCRVKLRKKGEEEMFVRNRKSDRNVMKSRMVGTRSRQIRTGYEVDEVKRGQSSQHGTREGC